MLLGSVIPDQYLTPYGMFFSFHFLYIMGPSRNHVLPSQGATTATNAMVSTTTDSDYHPTPTAITLTWATINTTTNVTTSITTSKYFRYQHWLSQPDAPPTPPPLLHIHPYDGASTHKLLYTLSQAWPDEGTTPANGNGQQRQCEGRSSH